MKALAERANHLFRYKTIKILDGREMGIGITASEFNRSCHSLQKCSE